MSDLTHFDESGASRMVDVGSKELTQRRAIAIPAESRSDADPDFHPELAPR